MKTQIDLLAVHRAAMLDYARAANEMERIGANHIAAMWREQAARRSALVEKLEAKMAEANARADAEKVIRQ